MTAFVIRPARPDEDAPAMARLFAAVAEERDGIATEPPVQIDERAALLAQCADEWVLAVADGGVVGMVHVKPSPYGFGELGMLVDRRWRRRRVGSALVQAAIARAHRCGLHKLSLEVFTRNTAAITLYRRYGFVEEGHRTKQYRRGNGELWDSIIMGLLL